MVVLSATKERVQKAFSNYILIDFNYIIQTYDMIWYGHKRNCNDKIRTSYSKVSYMKVEIQTHAGNN